MAAHTCALAFAAAVFLSVTAAQVESPCPVNLNVRNRLHPNGITGTVYTTFVQTNGQNDIAGADPINGGSGCNLIAINLPDFIKTTGATFCQNPSTTTPTTTPANLPITPTTSSVISGTPVFNPATNNSTSNGRKLKLLQCGQRSNFAGHLFSTGAFKQSSANALQYYGIIKGTDGTTYFGTATDGSCLGPNYINVDKFLFQEQISIAGLCVSSGVTSG
ncbi:hypothetical protein WJX73_001194 [Symbiochloris irregularis]|uniref:Uncharacterized protein n=1 Tax=Symbiochloris irregularis TaxID=706552 RepID=A0AAW1NPH4_9CHLO